MSEEETIEIEYRPIKRVTIIDCTELPLKELTERVQAMTQLGQPTPLNWAEGVAFLYSPLLFETDDLIEKYLKGEAVFQGVVYALMPDYSPTISAKPYGVHVVNQTPNKVLREVAKWLKINAQKPGESDE